LSIPSLLNRLQERDVQTAAAAIAKADEVIAELAVTSAPVPVEKIARKLGVQVRYAPFDGEISGMSNVRDGVSIIGVNNLHHPHRQRFTLAHELGHVLLHADVLERHVHLDRGSLYRNSLSSAGTDAREKVANAFASELLIPAPLLEHAIDDRLDLEDDEAVGRLAKRFKVSLAAMHYRLSRQA
jgi:Zn-dependent peptidase ImmA (M78 family)